MRTAFKTEIAGYEISLSQDKRGWFRVKYGLQEEDNLTYSQACMELGSSILHALACEGEINNEGP